MKPLLILDIDGTLIHARHSPTSTASLTSREFTFVDADGDAYTVTKRPHLEAFLTWCFSHFSVTIWSRPATQN